MLQLLVRTRSILTDQDTLICELYAIKKKLFRHHFSRLPTAHSRHPEFLPLDSRKRKNECSSCSRLLLRTLPYRQAISCCGEEACSGKAATPKLAVSVSFRFRPPLKQCSAIRSRMRSATVPARSICVSGNTITNSSPP